MSGIEIESEYQLMGHPVCEYKQLTLKHQIKEQDRISEQGVFLWKI